MHNLLKTYQEHRVEQYKIRLSIVDLLSLAIDSMRGRTHKVFRILFAPDPVASYTTDALFVDFDGNWFDYVEDFKDVSMELLGKPSNKFTFSCINKHQRSFTIHDNDTNCSINIKWHDEEQDTGRAYKYNILVFRQTAVFQYCAN